MDRLRNPFSPGAGSPPPELAGRGPLLDQAQFVLARIKAGRHEKIFLMVGLRGVGKTVLLNRIRELADHEGYQAIFVEVHEGKKLPQLLIPAMRQTLLALDRGEKVSATVKRAIGALRSFIGTIKVKV